MSKLNYYYPELNYWFYKFINSYGENNQDLPLHTYIPLPEIEYDENLITHNSIFELLFNDNFYSDTSSVITQFGKYDINYTSPHILRRLKVTGHNVQIFTTSLIGDYDPYDLADETSDNSILVERLLEYRMTGTTDISDLDYNTLSTTLSKLIYQYLNLKVSGVYDLLVIPDLRSESDELLDNMFEMYVYAQAHKLIKDWKKILHESITELKQKSLSIDVDPDFITTSVITINEDLPVDTDSIFIYKNGEKLPSDLYSINLTGTECVITLDNTNMILRPYDKIIVKYLYEEVLMT